MPLPSAPGGWRGGPAAVGLKQKRSCTSEFWRKIWCLSDGRSGAHLTVDRAPIWPWTGCLSDRGSVAHLIVDLAPILRCIWRPSDRGSVTYLTVYMAPIWRCIWRPSDGVSGAHLTVCLAPIWRWICVAHLTVDLVLIWQWICCLSNDRCVVLVQSYCKAGFQSFNSFGCSFFGGFGVIAVSQRWIQWYSVVPEADSVS